MQKNKTPNRRLSGRPLKQTSPNQQNTRKLLLQIGIKEFTQRGFSATKIDHVLFRAQVAKGSFYHYFPSKENFVSEMLEYYRLEILAQLMQCFQCHPQSPFKALHNFVNLRIHEMQQSHFSHGCLAGVLSLEVCALPDYFREKLHQVFVSWQTLLAQKIRETRSATKEISMRLDSEQLAFLFWIGWEGAISRACLEKKPEALQIFADEFFTQICH